MNRFDKHLPRQTVFQGLLFLFMALLAACSTQSEAAVTPTGSNVVIVETPTAVLPTGAPSPTHTNTAVMIPTDAPTAATTTIPTVTATPTLASRPSKTPRPTHTPTTTPIAHLDLPDWMIDPDTAVLMANAYDNVGDEFISFIRAETGERFDLRLNPRYGQVAWGQDEAGIYFEMVRFSGSRSDGFRDRVHIMTGAAERLSLKPPDMTLTPTAVPLLQEPYTVKVLADDSGKTVHITETVTNISTMLADPFNGRHSQWVLPEWTVDNAYLFVWRGSWVEAENIAVGDTVVYNPQGQVVATHENTDKPAWAPDESRQLLYIDIYNGRRLCVSQVETGQIDCDGLSLWREENETSTTLYTWSPDGRSIFFAYTRLTDQTVGFCLFSVETHQIICPVDEKPETWRISNVISSPTDDVSAIYYYRNVDDVNRGIKQICFYHWTVSQVTCPVDDIVLEENMYIHYSSWSSDGRFLSLILHDGCPGCDDRSFALLAIVDIVQNNLTWFDGYVYYGHDEALWRPSLSSE